MFVDEIIIALSEIFKVYGITCCVNKIQGHIITMSNGEEWVFNHEGNIRRYEREEW